MKTDLSRLIEETLGIGDFALTKSPSPARTPDPMAFPFRTDTARKVWAVAQQVMGAYPHLDNKLTLQLAVEKAGVRALDLTPEDWRLLEMAIEAQRSSQRWMRPATGDLGDELPKL